MKTHRHYASLWDMKYCPQGIALYQSLVKHSSEPFTLHVLALDDDCVDTLHRLGLPNLQIVNLRVFEVLDINGLEAIRASRTWPEYCWTLASQWCESLMQEGLGEITYLDADVYFFSDPAPVFAEIGDRSIAITPHRFVQSRKWMEATSGVYNVGWITFRNTPAGIECLQMWALQVRNQCSAVSGCGDQKYLDQFVPIFGREVCVIQNIGVNLAPWNLANYRVESDADGTLLVGVPKDGFWNWTPVVFYHAHEYIHGVRWTDYALRIEDIRLIYKPYEAAVTAAKERIGALQAA